MKLCALSVDLDEIPCYHAIHGLSQPSEKSSHAVYAIAVPRFLNLFHELRVPCTFFVIGRDMSDPLSLEAAKTLHQHGHELANHSQNHRYDLVKLSREEQRAEVLEGISQVAKARGTAPTGFRAPGYTLSDGLFEILAREGVKYDSSVFPCPAYWAAKTAAIGAIALRGRKSHSVVDTPWVLRSPADPYRPGRPYWTSDPSANGPMELPLGVTRFARLPYIGTALTLAGVRGALMLTRQITGRPLVNLELHGIDLLDSRDGLESLEKFQPDLRVSREVKLEVLKRSVGALRSDGYTFVTLDEASRTFASG